MRKLIDQLPHVTATDRLAADGQDYPGGRKLISRAFIKAFNHCPLYEDDFIDHSFTLLSAIESAKVERARDLLDKIKNHQWAAAHERQACFQDFKPRPF